MAGTNETSYFLKHGNNLNPLVSKKSDLEDQNIPKWDDTEQRLTDSAVSESYDSVADETTVAIDGNAEIDGKASITSDTAIGGNVEVDGTSQFNDDVTIGKAAQGADPEVQADLHVVGNIYQSGASVQTHLEQIYTTKDHIILRNGQVSGLSTGEHAGLKIIKPDGTSDFHLCVKNDNYAYVGETDPTTGEPYTNTYSYQFTDHGLYQDEDPDSPTYEKYFDDVALTVPHEFYIPSGATNVVYTDVTQVGDIKKSVQIDYDLSGQSLQRLLTIEHNPTDQSLLIYDNKSKEARTIDMPANPTNPLVPVLDGGRVTYREYKAGGEGEGDANNWSGTLAEYETAEQVVDPDDPDYIKDKSGVDIYGMTAVDLDIATEVREGDNQPVTSGAVYDYIDDSVKEYIRNQNILGDWETITISTNSSSPTIIPYDGSINIVANPVSSSSQSYIYLYKADTNDIICSEQSSSGIRIGIVMNVKKGDSLYLAGSNYGTITALARYYKLRDYTGR